ncbi:MAG: hypothetical protein AB7F75_02440 [Planctomycetota bacterium]
MKRWLTVLLLATACASFSGNHQIMLEFGPRLERVAAALRASDVKRAESAAADFNAYLDSEGYQKYVHQQEPNSQTRWLMLAESLRDLEDQAAAGRLTEARAAFTKTRDACLSCHYITRLGENRTFLDREIADITSKDNPEAGGGR